MNPLELKTRIPLPVEAIADLCERHGVERLDVFGSILRDDFRPDSDIDFLVSYDHDAKWDLYDVMEMKVELARTMGRSVDLISRSAIEQSDNRFVKKEVLSTAERVYAKR